MEKLLKNLTPTILLASALVILIMVIMIGHAFLVQESEAEIITTSTLEQIINVSDLSTFASVYNGVTQVTNEKYEIDYYVSYEAIVKAGIDLDKVQIALDKENKAIQITLPRIHITETRVDIESLDFLFFNDKANQSSVSEEAFKACKMDVERETEQAQAIYDLAKQNAINVLSALIQPVIDQLDGEYTLVFN